VDLVISNATVVTMNANRDVLHGAELVLRDGRIAEVNARPRAKLQGFRRVIDARGQVVLPGLIHGHLHACQTLCRNHADGLELLEWLRERIWPFEAAHDAASLRASADLTFLELIRSGATACLDMGTVRHYDAVFESARDAGVRLVGGKCMMDAGQGVPHQLRETTEASLAESLALIERWHGQANDRLRYALAPRFVLSCTEQLLRRVGELALEKKVRIHTHTSENTSECEVVREKTGTDNVLYFQKLGLLGPHTTLAHAVWLTAEEQRVLRETKTRLTHCPSANLKLASGFAKVPELLDQGIPVALGADGAACNNNLDIFTEMRLAALIHKPRAGSSAMAAQRVLEMATLHGAKALGLEGEVGAIEPGLKADLIVVDLRDARSTPGADDVVSTLVHSANSTDVRHVVIDGRVVMFERQVTTMSPERVVREARSHAARLLETLA
jgi:cytosine/adenosine deaminase-related metal-dependent hydrolase